MFRSVLVSVALAILSFPCYNQPLVAEIAGGVNPQGVSFMLADSANDKLFLAGSFTYANDIQVSPGILEWDGAVSHSIGCGVEWDCVSFINQAGLANPTRALAQWEGDLYLGGDISFSRNGYDYEGIMRWDGNEWYPLANGVDGKVTSLKVINGQLIVAGWFMYADTVLANGLARWDGERWHRVVDVPQFFPGDNNYVQDVEKFQDEWYLGGNIGSIRGLAKWDGDSWEIVGGGFTGSFAQVSKLRVYDDRLFVAGSFNQCPPSGNPMNPGSGIVAWDGSTWDDLGGGTCGSNNPAVIGIIWWNDQLYAAGLFDRMGGEHGGKLAKWDGEQWCMLTSPGYFGNGSPGALAVYHDSLFIGGAFTEVGGYDVSCFGKWIGGNETYACGALVGVEDLGITAPHWELYPNPARSSITLSGDLRGVWSYAVHDALGQVVASGYRTGGMITVDHLAIGVYTVVLYDQARGAIGRLRFVRE